MCIQPSTSGRVKWQCYEFLSKIPQVVLLAHKQPKCVTSRGLNDLSNWNFTWSDFLWDRNEVGPERDLTSTAFTCIYLYFSALICRVKRLLVSRSHTTEQSGCDWGVTQFSEACVYVAECSCAACVICTIRSWLELMNECQTFLLYPEYLATGHSFEHISAQQKIQ